MPELNVVFAGSPEFAATILNNLLDSAFAPVAVFTQPDRPKGRGRKLQANPVKQLADARQVPVEQPATLKDKTARQALASYEPDIMVVAAYGLILPPTVLRIPGYGCLNVHASLLPRWRGAAPIERAAIAGDSLTGACIMHMEKGLDTGPVYNSVTVPIDYTSTIAELEMSLAQQGSECLLEILNAFSEAKEGSGRLPKAVAQDDQLATYASKLTAADRHLNWQKSAETLARQVWALADRLPVRARLNNTGMQILQAQMVEQTDIPQNQPEPGTIVDASKHGITVQCATDLLQIKAIKIEGKQNVLGAADAMLGYAELFRPGGRFANSADT
ncbi:MAG: methionyl-tRNA formyltransferase [Pseudomonadota bacterium]